MRGSRPHWGMMVLYLITSIYVYISIRTAMSYKIEHQSTANDEGCKLRSSGSIGPAYIGS